MVATRGTTTVSQTVSRLSPSCSPYMVGEMVTHRAEHGGDNAQEPRSYGSYLRVPELLRLQSPLSDPEVHGELLFIIVQQTQELWFKQILHELRPIIDLLGRGELEEATHMLDRVNRILRILAQEVEILETLPPAEFQHFRGLLKTASGFESEQFRLLELASGLDDDAYLRLASHALDLDGFRREWPHTLARAFVDALHGIDPDPVQALVRVYADPSAYPDLYRLAEALSDYEGLFAAWRFHHMRLVDRVIGGRSPGTGGSPGARYLMQTLRYRFFPALWEARNELTAALTSAASQLHDSADDAGHI
jgi:tryptophan 2,3-dioxygenase